ncbi:MAG TPA: folate-binding protein YgfZ [Gammaproteobacteria bacterium]|nr:folate-binding protein YgfZ [Gammaproteobacteria bacterium]
MKPEWKQFLVDAGAELDDGAVAHFGTPDRERQVATTGNVFADLSHLGVIGVHGEDAANFLQGQLTADLRDIDSGRATPAGHCDPKGRLLATLRVFRRDDRWALELPRDQVEFMLERLHKFVLRARVTLEDASDGIIRIGVSGPEAAAELEEILVGAVPAAPWMVAEREDASVIRLPGPHPRFEIAGERVEPMRRLWERLNVRCAPVGADAWQLLEIIAGLPTVYARTSGEFLPQMVNLDRIGGVSFRKGCYPGQEVVARVHSRGRVKRRMYRAHLEADATPAPGDPVLADGERTVGAVVDARPHPDSGSELLAVVEIDAASGTGLHLDAPGGRRLTLETLPYAVDGDSAAKASGADDG